MNEPEMSRTARAGGDTAQTGGLAEGSSAGTGGTCWYLAAGAWRTCSRDAW